jgi:hypothetical protein
MKEQDFNFLSPDITRLDEEWILQPKIFHEWAIRLEKANRNIDRAKAALDIIKADLDNAIRRSPEKFKLPEKLTEAVITNTILRQSKYQEGLQLVEKANYKAGVCKATVNALNQRKSALENLVVLWSRDYFATPKAKEGTEQVVDKMRDKKAFKSIHIHGQEGKGKA